MLSLQYMAYPQDPRFTRPESFTQKVVRYSGGALKDETQAGYVLLGFAGVAIVVSLFFFSAARKSSEPISTPVPADQILPQ